MKISTSSISAFLCALLLALCAPLFAQTGAYSNDASFSPTYPGDKIRFTCQPDSVAKDSSRTFNIGKYIGEERNLTTNPISAQRTISSVLGAVKVTTFIDGTYDKVTFYACDTLGTDISTETPTRVTFDLNGMRFPFYRMRTNNIATGRRDTICDWILYMLP